MKKAVWCLLLFCSFSFAASAQVAKIELPQLEKRIANPDTVYVVNFWATWCGPCVKELPAFDKLQVVYKNQPLKVLLVSMDFELKYRAVGNFAKTHKLQSEVYLAIRKSDQELIDGIDKAWSGALPGTLIVNARKGVRKFYEQEFSYDELNELYKTLKN